MPPFQVIFAVATQHTRPTLPPDTPQDYTSLVQDCWKETPEERPDFQEILDRLDGFDPQSQPYTAVPKTFLSTNSGIFAVEEDDENPASSRASGLIQ